MMTGVIISISLQPCHYIDSASRPLDNEPVGREARTPSEAHMLDRDRLKEHAEDFAALNRRPARPSIGWVDEVSAIQDAGYGERR